MLYESKDDPVMSILVVEAWLTDQIVASHNQFFQMQILENGLRVLLNMVHGRYELKDTKKLNWIQPLAALQGRSILAFMLGEPSLKDRLDENMVEGQV
jgi:hypothetical protein